MLNKVSMQFGFDGNKVLEGAGAVTPDANHFFYVIYVYADTTFTAFTGTPLSTTTAYPAGSVIPGKWSSLTPAAGGLAHAYQTKGG